MSFGAFKDVPTIEIPSLRDNNLWANGDFLALENIEKFGTFVQKYLIGSKYLLC